MIYLDNSATTQVCSEAARTVMNCMTHEFFNPAASYKPAVQMERKIDEVREKLAENFGCHASEVFFTSGGTESNNIAILGTAALAKNGTKFVTTAFEHPSVSGVFSAIENSGKIVERISLGESGEINYEQLEHALNEETALVSIMHVNNEVGSVQDLGKIAAMIKSKAPQAVFHSDGVQAFLKLSKAKLPADSYSISAHKFHGPKGIGALMLRSSVKNAGGQIGGGQEKGVRSGTLNTAGILGMGAAIPENDAMDIFAKQITNCKRRLASNLMSIQDTFINGPAVEKGAPHILSVSFMGVNGETLLHALEEQGVYVSIGSACSAKKIGKNKILEAIGLDTARIESTIRISLCRYNTIEEMDMASHIMANAVQKLRQYKRR